MDTIQKVDSADVKILKAKIEILKYRKISAASRLARFDAKIVKLEKRLAEKMLAEK